MNLIWKRLGFSVACVWLGASAGCSSRPVQSVEEVSTTKQAVGQGDSTNDYRYSGYLTDDFSNSACSGVLISPIWFLTANHCVTGATKKCLLEAYSTNQSVVDTVYSVMLDQDGQDGSSLSLFHSDPDQFGLAIPRVNRFINSCSSKDASLDIALIRLATRVPSNIAEPLHPPLSGQKSCDQQDSFTGRLVGYGPTSALVLGLLGGGAPEHHLRNTHTSGGWERLNTSDGDAEYRNTWVMPPILGAITTSPWYTGGLPGDSGSPLIRGDLLCAIFSQIAPGTTGFPFFYPELVNRTAALDSPPNQQLVAAHVLDSKGNFMSECGGVGPWQFQDKDSDNDFIPDACDPCPTIADASYRENGVYTNLVDTDGDGAPDICDSCPLTPNPRVVRTVNDRLAFIQPDLDVDGVGDACDSCPDSYQFNETRFADYQCCTTNADCKGQGNACVDVSPTAFDQKSCLRRCEAPSDSDLDGTADNCDNCPGLSNSSQADRDKDGIGDSCDDCPGNLGPDGPQPKDQHGSACTFIPENPGFSDFLCKAIDPASVCVPGHYSPVVPCRGPNCIPPFRTRFDAQCSHGFDSDKDGVGDRCDTCPFLANPAARADVPQPNCNADSEVVNGIPYPGIGDACDRTPCPSVTNFSVPPDGQVGFGNFGFVLNPILLPQNQPFAYKYNATPTTTVGVRFCNCGDGDTPQACSAAGQCRLESATSEYAAAISNFEQIDVRLASLPNNAPFAPNGEFNNLTFAAPAGIPETPEVHGGGAVAVTWQQSNFAGRGVFWSHTVGIPQLLASDGSGAAVPPVQYTDLSNHYGLLGWSHQNPPLAPIPGLGCVGPNCDPIKIGGCPSPGCDPIRCQGCQVFPPNFFVNPGDPYRYFRQWGGLSDEITARFEPLAAALLVGSARRWLPSAERVPPGGILGAAISQDGTRVFGGLRENAGRFEQLPLFASELLGTRETALFAATDLKVNDRVHVIEADGSPAVVAAAGGDTNIGVDALVGPLWSANSVTLRDRAVVSGAIRVGGLLTRAPTSGVLGTQVPSTAFALPDLSAFNVSFPLSNSGIVALAPNEHLTLLPGAYGALSLNAGAALTLSSGRYFFESATLQPGALLSVDTTLGPVFAYVHSSLLYSGTIVDTRGAAGEFLLGYLGTSDANINAPFTGTLVAPNAKVSLISATSPGHFGSFFAKSLEVHQGTILTHRPFAHPWEFGSVEPAAFRPDAPQPASRADFGSVFSSSRSEVYVLGGTLASGGLAGDIWAMQVGEGSGIGGRWRQLPLTGAAPGRVLAATYRASDQTLYWVDEANTIRLVRYGLSTHISTILSSVPRVTNFDQLFLTVTPQSDILLATSKTAGARNCVALLSPGSSSLTVKWGLASDGVLHIAPSLTDQGLFLDLVDSTPFGSSPKQIPPIQLPTSQPFALGTCL